MTNKKKGGDNKNLSVSGSSIHRAKLTQAAKMTGVSKSRLTQILIDDYLSVVVQKIKSEKNEKYLRICEFRRQVKSGTRAISPPN